MKKLAFWIYTSILTIILTIFLVACEYTYPESQPVETPETITNETPIKEGILTEEGYYVYNDVQPPYYGADPNKTVILVNNESATNPTWQELKKFLRSDKTDDNDYMPGIRVCAEFAAQLHNNAEEAGIRAAWVAIEFEDDSQGHAINAFETTNVGLVFIDNTGSIPIVRIPSIDPETIIVEAIECFDTNDKKAYVQIGRQLGFIGLDVLASSNYKSYIEYINKWEILRARMDTNIDAVSEFNIRMDAYNSRIEELNKQVEHYESLVKGRTVIEDEYRMLSNMYDELNEYELELDQIRSQLDQERQELTREIIRIDAELSNLGHCRREPLGKVKRVEIYW